VVDARRCLAWLAQAPGDFPEDLREALGQRLYGCDDCQDVCPVNRRAGEPPEAETDATDRVDLVDLLESDDETLLARHGRWYLTGRDPRVLRRNALVALGNGGPADDRIHAVLDRYASGDDALLARHAMWALARTRLRGLNGAR
jgi:epoxyqueuosine reductase